jgi:hypothetical protein
MLEKRRDPREAKMMLRNSPRTSIGHIKYRRNTVVKRLCVLGNEDDREAMVRTAQAVPSSLV